MKVKKIPSPTPTETQSAFQDRCMGDAVMVAEYPDQKQRFAVCSTAWDNRNKETKDLKVTQRAYSMLTVKAMDDEKRIIEGIATTPTPDRYADVVEPKGMVFKLPLPLLWQHNTRQPIGQVTDAKVSEDGIKIKAQIAKGTDLPVYVHEAWSLIKAGLVPGLSIGFRGIEESYNRDTGGYHYIQSEWIELSAVTIPANAEATITAIKSADALLLAASGREAKRPVTVHSPAAVGSDVRGKTVKVPIAKQIQDLEAKRAAHDARMLAITEKAGDENRTFEADEKEEYDTLEAEVAEIDEHLPRLRKLEKQLVSRAQAPEAEERLPDPIAGNGKLPAHAPVQVSRNMPKGIGMARYIICMHEARGVKQIAAQIAAVHCKDTPEVELLLKSEVAVGTTVGTTWALPLMPPAAVLYSEFLDLLRPATILGRLPGIRYVPFNVVVPAQTGGGTFGWVGEAQAKPVSAMAFTTVTLPFNKVAGIVPMSKELLRFSEPSAEILVTNSLVKDAAQFIDTQLLDPAVHLSTGVNPASLTDQVVPKAPSGTTAAAFRADLKTQIGVYITASDDPREIYILMSATEALALSLLRNSLGVQEFPNISINGGSIEGFPVIVSEAVSTRIVFVKNSDILVADGGVEIDMSQEASLVMDTAPQSSPLATSLVSLYQRNMVAIRVEKLITWKKGRSHTVQYINSVNYGS